MANEVFDPCEPTGYDLLPCPLCGSECYSDTVSLFCTKRHANPEVDARGCVYMLDDDTDAPGWTNEAADARLSDAHNRLYRRAELGRILEKIVPFGLHNLMQEQNSGNYIAGSRWLPNHVAHSRELLDLFRQMERAVDKAAKAGGAQ